MFKNTVVLTAICLLLCLNFNCTLPLQKDSESKRKSTAVHTNEPPFFKRNNPMSTIAQRTRKMALKIENAYKKFKEPNCTKPTNMNDFNKKDLEQYEQMVIMKKYPYLDLKDLEFKYSPDRTVEKHTKAKIKIAPPNNLGGDPSICEAPDDAINVEIVNRGLTGFAIPPPDMNTIKLKVEIPKANYTFNENLKVLSSLKNDILKYEEEND